MRAFLSVCPFGSSRFLTVALKVRLLPGWETSLRLPSGIQFR